MILVKKLHEDAKIPAQSHIDDACFDLFALEDTNIGMSTTKVRLGIAMEIPQGYEGVVRPRSSSFAKKNLNIHLGTIDSGYRGELMVLVSYIKPPFSIDIPLYTVKKGESIAQIAFRKVPRFVMVETDKLSDSSRGEGGFGSTDFIDFIKRGDSPEVAKLPEHEYPTTMGTATGSDIDQCVNCYQRRGFGSPHCFASRWSL